MTARIDAFGRSSEAAISVVTAILSTVIVGFAGIAVDTGSVVYWNQRLRTATDAAAMAATFDPTRGSSIAGQSLQSNGLSSAIVDQVDVGTYTDDPSLGTAARFQVGGGTDAVRITTSFDAPVYFMRLFTGSSTVSLGASATAYNLPLGGLAIGTGVVDANIAQLNSFMTAQSGSVLNLTAAERDALDSTPVAVFRIFDALADDVATPTSSISDVMASNANLRQVADAMSTALGSQTTTPAAQQATALAALTRISQQSGGSPATLISDVLSLGAHQQRAAQDLVSSTTDTLTVPALTVLMGYMHASKQNAIVNMGPVLTIPAVATISAKAVLERPALAGGEGSVVTVGPVGTSAYSSSARVALTVQLLGGLLPPFQTIVDIGYGAATISNVTCGPDISNTTDVEVSAQTGALRLYIGNVTDGQLANFLVPLVPTAVPSLISVSGPALVLAPVSGTLHFDRAEIAQGTTKSVGNPTSSLAAIMSALNNNLIATGPLAAVIQPVITSVLTVLQPNLSSVLASLGLRAGYMDIRATSVRCGIPALVT